ncbi:PREDICTED: PRA1 [Prunus dulcis]|uniref:PRA1 family protein n=1 Tax=Prunus dulcis TaxID=3755 RepID=A0A5E4G0P6_PRUDU|nr:PREDICTED: PRA1 [Prunus dulcis]
MSTGLVSQVKEVSQSAIATLRPWGELLEPTALSLPSNLSEVTTRLAQNLTHFRSNYTLVLLIVLFLSLIYHPVSIIVFLIIFAAWLVLYFSRDQPLEVFGFTVGDRVVMVILGPKWELYHYVTVSMVFSSFYETVAFLRSSVRYLDYSLPGGMPLTNTSTSLQAPL